MENYIERRLREINEYIKDIEPLILQRIKINFSHNKGVYTNAYIYNGLERLFSTTIYWEYVNKNLYWLKLLSFITNNIFECLRGEYVDE